MNLYIVCYLGLYYLDFGGLQHVFLGLLHIESENTFGLYRGFSLKGKLGFILKHPKKLTILKNETTNYEL